ncbi:MAG: zinc ABC transporter substrate-binding protein AztC [Acidimicrobiia bacterium]|nr:MAG: zinc ABC transporter substrate-binding protein AztC [Acidimicrobiia bacterium]
MDRKTAKVLGGTLVAFALVVGACSGVSTDDPPDQPLQIVVTTTVLGDIVSQIVGDQASVETIIPNGVDPHEFQPSSRQVAAIATADLVIVNGLGLEEGLLDVVSSAESDGTRVLRIGELVDPLPFDRKGGSCTVPADGSSAVGDCDPHAWMDPLRMLDASVGIGGALASIDPTTDWATGVDAYVDVLEQLDAEVEAIVATIPQQKRLLVSNHDALGYFAARYGFEIVGTVIPGGSTLADPSSSELENLVTLIDGLGVPAVFAETQSSKALAEAVAREAGRDVAVIELYTGSLGPEGSGAETYVGMIRADAQLIVDGLGG